MRDLIRRIIKEQIVDKKQMLQDLVKSSGFNTGVKMVGGPENYIRIMYGGDFNKFVQDNNI